MAKKKPTKASKKPEPRAKRVPKKAQPKKVIPKKTHPMLIIGVVVAFAILLFAVVKFQVQQPAEEKGAVLATVNGVPVYQKEVDDTFDRLPAAYKQYVQREVILNQTIARELLLQEANEQGYTANGEEIDSIIDDLLQANQMTEEQLEEQLQQNNYTIDRLKVEYVKQVLIGKLINETVYSKIQVTVGEVRQYYDDNEVLFEQLRASHILVNSSEAADGILDKLKKGADFATLAQAYSLDQGSAANGGDLNYFSRNMMVEPFADAAFALEVGQLSEPVQTQYGWHIIKATSRRYVSFEEARDQIAQNLWNQKQPDAVQAFIDTLWEKADVVIY
jgi:foldase protein PrsA